MQIFEVLMLVCFGLSWPISVYKSIRSRSTKGKSVVFIVAIIIGYVSGILGKIVNHQLSYVVVLYCLNLKPDPLTLVVMPIPAAYSPSVPTK